MRRMEEEQRGAEGRTRGEGSKGGTQQRGSRASLRVVAVCVPAVCSRGRAVSVSRVSVSCGRAVTGSALTLSPLPIAVSALPGDARPHGP